MTITHHAQANQYRVQGETGMSMINTRKSANSKLEFNLLLWLAFAVFFVAIALNRLLPKSMRRAVGGHDEGKSIVEAAKHATYNSIPFAFM